MRRTIAVAAVLLMAATSSFASSANPWYESASAIHRVTLKPTTKYWRFEHLSTDPNQARRQMLQWKNEGISALEIFAPEEGGNSYDGLDAINRYSIDSAEGTMRDFRNLVKLAHSLGLRVVTFQNLGYSNTEATDFLEAENEIREKKPGIKASEYLWSSRPDAPAPAGSNSYFFSRPALPNYDPMKDEIWQWSERAHAWYWSRWPGKDSQGNTIHLPQYNWASSAWPNEAGKVVRFWMGTGLDGMILDAVNWYTGANWQMLDTHVTDAIRSYGDELLQPEGGGAFRDDPTGWVTEGHFTNLFD
ncbi:MAG: alpha-amylase family glycosyl hydrolase, partial [Acidobacteriaceae bacterium]